MIRFTKSSIVVVAVLCLATFAFAEDPGTSTGGPIRAPLAYDQTIDAQVDGFIDIGGTPSPLATAAPPRITPEFTEASTADVKAASSTPASAGLASLDLAARMNAMIQLEPLNAVAEAAGAYAAEAMTLWNKGSFDLALAKIEQMEALGSRFAVGIGWRVPIATEQPEYYQDVRIGGTSIDSSYAAIDYHRGTGNIFVVTSWGPNNPNATTDWSLNMSSNNGVSFVETFSYFGDDDPLVDMVVVQNYVYVSYVNMSSPSQARFRRLSAITGVSDAVYGYHDVADVSPATVVSISAGANADEFNNRLYMVYIDSNNNIGYFWDDSADGKTFSDASPIYSAESGLDYHWNRGATTGHAYLSYIGTDGGVHALRWAGGTSWTHYLLETVYSGGAYHPRARVSAYDDNIFVAYAHDMTNARGCKYQISYNDGVSWGSGTLYIPGVSEPGGNQPDISARSGARSAALWNQEEGTPDEAYHIERSGFSPGGWTDPFEFSNYDVYSGGDNYIQYIGSTCVQTYGMVYFADDQIPYFDLIDGRGFFCDGFESGNTTGWN